MAHPSAKRAEVRAQYLQGLPLESAAAACGVSYPTARNWKRAAKADGDCWDTVRTARRMTGGGMEEFATQVVEQMATEFLATIAQVRENKDIDVVIKTEMLARLSDSYSKIMTAAARSSPKLSGLAVSMDVLKEITAYIAEHHPEQRPWFVSVLDGIGPRLAQRFS